MKQEDENYRQGRSEDRQRNSEDLAAIGIIGIIVGIILTLLFGSY